jgi:hypothetical protein
MSDESHKKRELNGNIPWPENNNGTVGTFHGQKTTTELCYVSNFHRHLDPWCMHYTVRLFWRAHCLTTSSYWVNRYADKKNSMINVIYFQGSVRNDTPKHLINLYISSRVTSIVGLLVCLILVTEYKINTKVLFKQITCKDNTVWAFRVNNMLKACWESHVVKSQIKVWCHSCKCRPEINWLFRARSMLFIH